jgi:hypothetical protein
LPVFVLPVLNRRQQQLMLVVWMLVEQNIAHHSMFPYLRENIRAHVVLLRSNNRINS